MLGSAFLVGGLWHPTQSFNREGTQKGSPSANDSKLIAHTMWYLAMGFNEKE